eukprot:TRINITY_DN406_c0_g1_i2.p1 TRINITY_DN406_c0_g1~~TRINITY_DN406_c0_g1_i2.p1  ORF type:complete len:421 (+),score=98.38 TRINITY_DN406_c0_g1_i2:73-1335(+)
MSALDSLCRAFEGLATNEAGTMPTVTAPAGMGRQAGGGSRLARMAASAPAPRSHPYANARQGRPAGGGAAEELASLLSALSVSVTTPSPRLGEGGGAVLEDTAPPSDVAMDPAAIAEETAAAAIAAGVPIPKDWKTRAVDFAPPEPTYNRGKEMSAAVTPETVCCMMAHVAGDKGLWETSSLEECRFLVSLLASGEHTEVPYRVCYTGQQVAAVAPGDSFAAPFAFVAPSPDASLYGTGDVVKATVVYTPRVSVGFGSIHHVIADIECKFLGHWETQHLISLRNSPGFAARERHSVAFVKGLTRAKENPGQHPPRLRPPNYHATSVPPPSALAVPALRPQPLQMPGAEALHPVLGAPAVPAGPAAAAPGPVMQAGLGAFCAVPSLAAAAAAATTESPAASVAVAYAPAAVPVPSVVTTGL